MRRRPKPIPGGRPAASWKQIPRANWRLRRVDGENRLFLSCPEYNCSGVISTLAKPGQSGSLIVSCGLCCTKQAVSLVGWADDAIPF